MISLGMLMLGLYDGYDEYDPYDEHDEYDEDDEYDDYDDTVTDRNSLARSRRFYVRVIR